MSRNRRRNGTRARVPRKIMQEQKITKDMLKSQLFAMGFAKENTIGPLYANDHSYCVRNGSSLPLDNSFWNVRGGESENVVAFNFLIGPPRLEEVPKSWSSEKIDSDPSHDGQIACDQSATFVTDTATESDDKSLYDSGAFDCSATIPFVDTLHMNVPPEPKSDISSFDNDVNLESEMEFEEKCDQYSCTVSSCIEAQKRLSSEEIDRYFKNISFCSYQPTVKLAFLSEDVIRSFSTRTRSEGAVDDENQAGSNGMSGPRVPPLKLRLRGSHWRVNVSGEQLGAPLVPALPGVVSTICDDVSSQSTVESCISNVETDGVSLNSLQSVSNGEGIETPDEQCPQPAVMFSVECTSMGSINSIREGCPVGSESQEENVSIGITDDVKTGEAMEIGNCFPSSNAADLMLSPKTVENVELHKGETEQEKEKSQLPLVLSGGTEAVEEVGPVSSLGCPSETLLCDAASSQSVTLIPSTLAKADDSGRSPGVEPRVDPTSPSERPRRASLRPRKRPPLKSVEKPVVKRLGTRIFLRPRRGMLSQRDETVSISGFGHSVASSSLERRRALPEKDVYQFDDSEFDAPLRYFRRISHKRQPMKPVVICVNCGIEKAFVARSVWDKELVPEGWCLSCNLVNWASKAPVMTRPQKSRKLRGLMDVSAGHRSPSLGMLQASIEPRARGRAKSQRKMRWRKIKKHGRSNWSSGRSFKEGVSAPVNGSVGEDPSSTTPGSLDGDSRMDVVESLRSGLSRALARASEVRLSTTVPELLEVLPTSVPGPLEVNPTSVPGPLEDPPTSVPGPLEDPPTSVPGPLEDPPISVPGALEDLPATVPASLEEIPSPSVSRVLGEDPSKAANESADDKPSGTSQDFSVDNHTAEEPCASPEPGRGQIDERNDPSDEAVDDYSCLWCGEEFSSSNELDAHSLSHAEAPDEDFPDDCSSSSEKCICCPSLAANASAYVLKMDTNHMSKGAPHDDATLVCEEQLSVNAKPCFSLSAAESAVASASELSDIPHHSSETIIFGGGQSSFECLDCLATFPTASGLRAHMISEHAQEVSIKCKLCGYISGSRHRHELHCAVSHNVFSHKCPICCDLFMSSQLLTFHQFHKHKLKNCRFICPVCNMPSSKPSFLTQHIRKEHKGSFPFSCWCGQSYDNLVSFKVHAEAHAAELFKLHCDVCFMWCPTKDLLDAHFALKHYVMSPYCCPSCDNSYSSLRNLSRHLKESHSHLVEYACGGCASRFPTLLRFWNHITTKGHMVQQVALRYRCRECDTTSFDRTEIAEHEETEHTGIVTMERAAKLFSLVREVL